MTPCANCDREKTWTHNGKCTACGGVKDDTPILKTEFFKGRIHDSAFDIVKQYQKFIDDHPHIDIVSVNTFQNDYILLTYREKPSEVRP